MSLETGPGVQIPHLPPFILTKGDSKMKYMLFVLALGLTACGDKSDDTGGKTGTSDTGSN